MATLKLNEEIIDIIERNGFYNKVDGIDCFTSYIKGYADEILYQFPIYGLFRKDVLDILKDNFVIMLFNHISKTYEFFFSYGKEDHAVGTITTNNNEVKILFVLVSKSNRFYIDFYRKISGFLEDPEQKKVFGFEAAAK